MSILRRKSRVLLLDDDPSMQRLVSKLLKDEGFKVDLVLTGRDAIAAIGRVQYDAMLLDLMMPHEGGLTVIRHLEAGDRVKLGRVIVLSGSPESVLGNVRDSVAAIVQKPFEAAELIAAVRRISKSK
jgi:DNA-binding response OmpR family regulator